MLGRYDGLRRTGAVTNQEYQCKGRTLPFARMGAPSLTSIRIGFASDRMAVLHARGGSAETEAAVQAALGWLAANQLNDGRWDASQFGGGQSSAGNGHDRQRAGLHADTGVTGLAVLAFLGAGHTHLHGTYQDTVRRAALNIFFACKRSEVTAASLVRRERLPQCTAMGSPPWPSASVTHLPAMKC